MKYQFCIRFKNIDANTASSKAVLDCNKIFTQHGYKDYTFEVNDNSKKLIYYFNLLKELMIFFVGVRRRSIIAIQYPLLSINNVFKYFIKIAAFKKVNFFCVVHDLQSLRTGGKDETKIKQEIENLNCYDVIIVHNNYMKNWLTEAGVKKKMITLELFDYLCDDFEIAKNYNANGTVVFAGNLRKSIFIYDLDKIKNKEFAVYGPGFQKNQEKKSNLIWCGEYSPDVIPGKLNGAFGLLWDGSSINEFDEILGNYLRYNNPHKCSLYIAAGLPIIAPATSAVGALIKKLNVGVLINNLYDVETLNISEASYNLMKENTLLLRQKIITGYFFSEAIKLVEKEYAY